MKKTPAIKNTIAVLLGLLALGCGEDKTPAQSFTKNDTTATGTTVADKIPVEPPVFTYEKGLIFGDTLAKYFSKIHGSPYEYTLRIDTLREKGFTVYQFKYCKNQKYPRLYYTEFEVYEFPTPEGATDYFNMLKTHELVLPFGINKRPNHILVNHNQVLWHHFEHPYGHRMEAIKGIFRYAFGFKPQAPNLDSISGFNYCRCVDQDPDLGLIRGHWRWSAWTDVFDPDSLNHWEYPHDPYNNPDSMVLEITTDSIRINGYAWFIRHKQSIELPSAYHFINDMFYNNWPCDSAGITPPAKKMLAQLRRRDVALTKYDCYLFNGPGRYRSFNFYHFGNGITWCYEGNRLYVMKHKRRR